MTFSVIDLGSNSVRLSIYESLTRSPKLIFEEGHFTELGRDLSITGDLWPKGVSILMEAMSRFHAITCNFKTSPTILATDAIRQSSQGAEVISTIEKEFKFKTRVLSGEEELFFGAQAIRFAFSHVTGFIADCGGGSMEVGFMHKGTLESGNSLPLGALRLLKTLEGDYMPYNMASAYIQKTLSEIDHIRGQADSMEPLYLMGGAWRTLAQLYIHAEKYPLPLVHGFSVARGHFEKFCKEISVLSEESLEKLSVRKRKKTLPRAALALYHLLGFLRPSKIIFCGCSIREGYLMNLLPADVQMEDPVVQSALSKHPNPTFAGLITDKFRPLFEDLPVGYLESACAHIFPHYPAQNVLNGESLALEILGKHCPGFVHEHRIFTAFVAYCFVKDATHQTYQGVWAPFNVLDKSLRKTAQALGLTLKFLYDFTGQSRAVLDETTFSCERSKLIFAKLPSHFAKENVFVPLKSAAKLLKKELVIVEGS